MRDILALSAADALRKISHALTENKNITTLVLNKKAGLWRGMCAVRVRYKGVAFERYTGWRDASVER
jgi:hypothetical protein